MRLKLRLPQVQPTVYQTPTRCPHPRCRGRRFQLRQTVPKPLRDTTLHEVAARRYACLRCGHTFRVYPLGVNHDQTSRGIVLTVDLLANEETATLQAWVEEIAAAVGAEVLVSDDADSFKQVADAYGLRHQVCKAHVQRNTQAWVEQMRPQLAQDRDGSLAAIAVTPEQAVVDVNTLLRLVQERPPGPEAEAQLAAIHERYIAAPSPRELGQEQMSPNVVGQRIAYGCSVWIAGSCGDG